MIGFQAIAVSLSVLRSTIDVAMFKFISSFIILLLVVVFSTQARCENSAGKYAMKFTTSITVNASLEVAHQFVSNYRNFPLWHTAIVDIQPVGSSTDFGLGSTFEITRHILWGEHIDQVVVTEFEPLRSATITISAGSTPLEYQYHLAKIDNNTTEVTINAKWNLPKIAYLVSPIVKIMVKRGVNKNLSILKKLLDEHENIEANLISN
jgi:hypothetical protein